MSAEHFELVRLVIAGALLLAIAVSDARTYLIPDRYTVTGLGSALAFAVVWVLFMRGETHFAGPYDAVLGACVGAGAIRIVGWLGEIVLRKEAMGFGDETLMAFGGALLGPPRTLFAIVAAAALGSVVFVVLVAPVLWVRARQRGVPFLFPEVPFGVFLAPAVFGALLWGNPMVTWYLKQILGR
jgi:leader peptidase (prepilin peptidase)/N-methyltransferase